MPMSPSELYKLITQLQQSGLSHAEIEQQMKYKETSTNGTETSAKSAEFDPYTPPVSGRENQAEYMAWRRKALKSGAELSSDRPMINQEKNLETLKNIDAVESSYGPNNKAVLKSRISANDAKFKSINDAATENLYQEMPDIRGEYGSIPAGALGELAMMEGAAKALSVPSAGEGSDTLPPEIQAEKNSVNDLYRQKRLEALSGR